MKRQGALLSHRTAFGVFHVKQNLRTIDMTTLFDPLQAGDLHLANRIAMAPCTRNRSPGGIPVAMNAEYYAQRAGNGLLITEGTAISHQGQGYADVPGLYTPEQLAGWRRVTDAVHAKGGCIVTQLWHVGRVSHVSLQPHGQAPVAPSAITAQSRTFILDEQTGAGHFAPRPSRAHSCWTNCPRSSKPTPALRMTRCTWPASTAWSCTAPTAT